MTTRQNNKVETLSQLRLFSGLNELACHFLESATQTGVARRHDYLIRRDGVADGFFVVVQGRVEVSLSTESGFSVTA